MGMSKKIPLHSLVIVIGPAGAGKTHLCKSFNPYEIVSHDDIKYQLIGESNRSDLTHTVGRIVTDMVRTKLTLGERVVVDGQHVSRADRLAMAQIGVELGVPVFYLIVDRPLSEKIADGGWRLSYPNLIERSHAQFLEELPVLMQGDGVAEVIDGRVTQFTPVEKFSRTDFLADARARGFAGVSVIGDIHGQHTAAVEAIDWARQRNYLIVFLGDLIDYGPKNVEMIDTAHSYITRGLAVNVIGNHEVKIQKWFEQRHLAQPHIFISDGNRTTIRQIEQLPPADQMRLQTKFAALTGLGAHHWVLGGFIMAHGGVSEKMRQITDPTLKGKFGKFAMFGEFDINQDVLTHTYKWVNALAAGTVAVVGHDIRDTVHPKVVDNEVGGKAVFMDTGSGKGGYLSVADIPFSEMRITNFFRC